MIDIEAVEEQLEGFRRRALGPPPTTMEPLDVASLLEASEWEPAEDTVVSAPTTPNDDVSAFHRLADDLRRIRPATRPRATKPVAPAFRVPQPTSTPDEAAWVARFRALVYDDLGHVGHNGGPAEIEPTEENRELLDHCWKRAYRDDDLVWRAALTLLLARLGRHDEAERELAECTSRSGAPVGSEGRWLDIAATLAHARRTVEAGQRGAAQPSSRDQVVQPAEPASSLVRLPRSTDARPSPAYGSRWLSWEEAG